MSEQTTPDPELGKPKRVRNMGRIVTQRRDGLGMDSLAEWYDIQCGESAPQTIGEAVKSIADAQEEGEYRVIRVVKEVEMKKPDALVPTVVSCTVEE